ncbi:hypothetical protein EG68_12105, partial [Paragonimus skrjabini miyazakii]
KVPTPIGLADTLSREAAPSNRRVRHIPARHHVRIHELTRRHLNAFGRRQKEYYNKKTYGAPSLVGTNVQLHTDVPSPGILTKLHREWKRPLVSETQIVVKSPWSYTSVD